MFVNDFDKLNFVINTIDTEYRKTNKIWTDKKLYNINLKKKLVKDINSNHEIYSSIFQYLEFLNEDALATQIKIKLNILFKGIEFSSRIKAQNSIEQKIQYYLKKDNGQYPINKCLNDLLGFRVILSSNLNFDDIHNVVGNKYKCINSSKGEYIATHIYFSTSNFDFPWELQIWSKDNEMSNKSSHRKYKQQYTSWEKDVVDEHNEGSDYL